MNHCMDARKSELCRLEFQRQQAAKSGNSLMADDIQNRVMILNQRPTELLKAADGQAAARRNAIKKFLPELSGL